LLHAVVVVDAVVLGVFKVAARTTHRVANGADRSLQRCRAITRRARQRRSNNDGWGHSRPRHSHLHLTLQSETVYT
jgi:hypothetical protein